jgi:hypothetical protein
MLKGFNRLCIKIGEVVFGMEDKKLDSPKRKPRKSIKNRIFRSMNPFSFSSPDSPSNFGISRPKIVKPENKSDRKRSSSASTVDIWEEEDDGKAFFHKQVILRETIKAPKRQSKHTRKPESVESSQSVKVVKRPKSARKGRPKFKQI